MLNILHFCFSFSELSADVFNLLARLDQPRKLDLHTVQNLLVGGSSLTPEKSQHRLPVSDIAISAMRVKTVVKLAILYETGQQTLVPKGIAGTVAGDSRFDTTQQFRLFQGDPIAVPH